MNRSTTRRSGLLKGRTLYRCTSFSGIRIDKLPGGDSVRVICFGRTRVARLNRFLTSSDKTVLQSRMTASFGLDKSLCLYRTSRSVSRTTRV